MQEASEAEIDDLDFDEDEVEELFAPSPILWMQPDGAIFAYPFARYWGWRLDSPEQASELRIWHAWSTGLAPLCVVALRYVPVGMAGQIFLVVIVTCLICAYAYRIVKALPRAPMPMPKDVYLTGIAYQNAGSGFLKWVPWLIWLMILFLVACLVLFDGAARLAVLGGLLVMIAVERRATALRKIVRQKFPLLGT